MLIVRPLIVFFVLLRNAMGIRGMVVYFGSAVMVLAAKFIAMTSRHGLKIGVLQSPPQMPVSQFVFPFFTMFGGRPMSVRSKFVLIGRLPVCVVHVFLPWRILRLQESLFYRANTAGCLRRNTQRLPPKPVAEHGKAALGRLARGLVLNHILHSNYVGHNPVHGQSEVRKSPVQDDQVPFGHYRS
jgi:hypothetical protein